MLAAQHTVRSKFILLAMGAAGAGVLGAAPISTASAQVAYAEGADLNGQHLGTVAAGINTIAGSLAVTIIGGIPQTFSGDAGDAFSFTVPSGQYVTTLEMSISNFASSGTASANPGVRFVSPAPVSYAYCAIASGANTLTIPGSGRLGPGTYSFEVFTGKSPADTPGSRSFNYVLRFQTEQTGACCNRWTGHCAVMTSGECGAVGLRFDGAASTCSPTACSACPADFNGSGSISVDDIFGFLAAYFAGCP